MNKNNKVIKDAENTVNTFIFNTGINVRRINNKIKIANNKIDASKKISSDGVYINVRIVDVRIGVTLYENDGFNRDFGNLSKAGYDVLSLVIKYLQPNRDFIYIDVSKYAKEKDCTIRHIYKGIENLIDNHFLAKFKGSVYWINPHYFFKGNKAKYYDNRKDVNLNIIHTVTNMI